jgi:hypothetical protein
LRNDALAKTPNIGGVCDIQVCPLHGASSIDARLTSIYYHQLRCYGCRFSVVLHEETSPLALFS